jgi:hypothetical protein
MCRKDEDKYFIIFIFRFSSNTFFTEKTIEAKKRYIRKITSDKK